MVMEFSHISVASGGGVAVITLARPDKGNAIHDALLDELAAGFAGLGEDVRAVVLHGEGGHFCGGLDLAEHKQRAPVGVLHHSRRWHRVFDSLQFGAVPIVAALHGAVIGGGLELALCAHVRVADETAFYQLPEGRRGIFVGGGASVRAARVLGVDKLTEMMLTGRKYDAAEGQRLGLSHYLTPPGDALARAKELAAQIAENAPFSNYLMVQALARIAEMDRSGGLFTDSLAAALAQSTDEAREGLAAFLEKRTPDFSGGS
ncbi:MAG: crotonase/enoyl-CoA hydratase family protein [Alphaproteobacteria bacterium]